jgi:hypothetical protein
MHPATGPYLGGLFEFEGELFDCWLFLMDSAPIAPGDRVTVPVMFLRPHLIKPLLKVGDKFRLKDGLRVVAEGTIESL